MNRLNLLGKPSKEKTHYMGYLSKVLSLKTNVKILSRDPGLMIESQDVIHKSLNEIMEGVEIFYYNDNQTVDNFLENRLNDPSLSLTDDTIYIVDGFNDPINLGEGKVILFTTGDKDSIDYLETYIKWLLGRQTPTQNNIVLHLLAYQIYQDSKVNGDYLRSRVANLIAGTAYELQCRIHYFCEMDQVLIQENEYERRFYFKHFSKGYKKMLQESLEIMSIGSKKEIQTLLRIAERSKK